MSKPLLRRGQLKGPSPSVVQAIPWFCGGSRGCQLIRPELQVLCGILLPALTLGQAWPAEGGRFVPSGREGKGEADIKIDSELSPLSLGPHCREWLNTVHLEHRRKGTLLCICDTLSKI